MALWLEMLGLIDGDTNRFRAIKNSDFRADVSGASIKDFWLAADRVNILLEQRRTL